MRVTEKKKIMLVPKQQEKRKKSIDGFESTEKVSLLSFLLGLY